MIVTTIIGVLLTLQPDVRWLGYGVIGLSVLYLAIFVGRWWEHRRLTSKPHLDFQIHEVYIVPTNNTASCFLRVSIHNEIGAQVANPPSHTYSFRLTIKGKTYTDTLKTMNLGSTNRLTPTTALATEILRTCS
jgi:hypothetical protein